MSELHLICNYKKCRLVLNNVAWVTRCSHIFCDNDGSRSVKKLKKCPCCSEILNRQMDIVQINLNPDEPFKSVCTYLNALLYVYLHKYNYITTYTFIIYTTLYVPSGHGRGVFWVSLRPL